VGFRRLIGRTTKAGGGAQILVLDGERAVLDLGYLGF